MSISGPIPYENKEPLVRPVLIDVILNTRHWMPDIANMIFHVGDHPWCKPAFTAFWRQIAQVKKHPAKWLLKCLSVFESIRYVLKILVYCIRTSRACYNLKAEDLLRCNMSKPRPINCCYFPRFWPYSPLIKAEVAPDFLPARDRASPHAGGIRPGARRFRRPAKNTVKFTFW